MPDQIPNHNLQLGDPVQIYTHITRSPIPGDHIVFQIGEDALDGRRELLGGRVVKVREQTTGRIDIVSLSRLTPKEANDAL